MNIRSIKRASAYLLYFLNIAIILSFWLPHAFSRMADQTTNLSIELGNGFGLFAAYSLLVQIVLVGRGRWLERLFGLDHLSHAHHLNGSLLIIFIIFHPVFLTLGYSMHSLHTPIAQFFLLLQWPDVPLALAAYFIFIAIIITSVAAIRKKLKYEVWYLIHMSAYAALVLAFFHQFETGDIADDVYFRWYWYFLYAVTLGSLLVSRVLRPVYDYFHYSFVVDRIEPETEETASVYIKGRDIAHFPVVPGQFMIFRFFQKGLWWEAHPFSLSCADHSEHLRISVKNSGDFTSKIRTIQNGTRVQADGPYGVFTSDHSVRARALLIAGGIGITPLRSLAEEFAAFGRDTILIYSSRELRMTALKGELDGLAQRYPNFRVHYVMSNDPTWQGRRGRVTKELVEEMVHDVRERDVYLCGPPPMMMAAVRSLSAAGVPKRQIHYERFSL